MDDRGSIFVETLVACAILALVLGVGLGTVGESARRAGRADAAHAALIEVRSRLAAAGVDGPLAAGETSGADGDLAWRVEVEPYEGTGGAGALMRVTATAADVRVAGSTVSLTTLRLARA